MTTEENPGPGRRVAIIVALCSVIAAILGVVAALLGVIPTPWSGSDPCEGPRAAVSAPADVYDNTYTIIMSVACAPEEGAQYALVAQVLNVAAPGNAHDEWYVPMVLDEDTPGTYRHEADLRQSLPRSERRLYIISVPKERITDLNAGSSEPMLQAPFGEVVSNKFLVTKG